MKFPLCSVRIWWVFIFPNDYKSMEVKCKTNDTLELSQLVEFQGNLKERTDGDFEKIAKSIKKHGFAFPFFVWKHDGINHVLDGHGRIGALKRMVAQGEHLPPLPVVYVNAKDEADAKELLLKLNSHYGKMSAESVRDFLGDLQIDFEDLALPEGVLDLDVHIEEIKFESENEVIEDNAVLTPPQEPKSKSGQIYQLGRHRLMCGDSTNKNDIEKLMNGAKADLVFTDPPYGMKKESEGVANDNLNFDDLLEFNKKWIPLTFDALQDVGSWYCWGIEEPLMDIYSNILKTMIKNNQITFRNLITWDKGAGQGQMSEKCRMYAIASEKCLFVMKGVQGFNINADNYFEGWEPIRKYLCDELKKTDLTREKVQKLTNTSALHYFGKSQWKFITREHYKILQDYAKGKNHDAFKREYDDIKREYYKTRAYFNNTHDNMNDVWHFNSVVGKNREECGGHATPKPLKLCGRAIKSSTKKDGIVLDVFGGSGSTLIACEQLERSAYLMELEPKWVDVIIQRWEKHTGKKAILVSE